ncbi:hypothetical protein HK101_006992 [Irineochytrium annulatum]|nr:hypothetical protein HK101_006992 [Irineochytrium annulatum]
MITACSRAFSDDRPLRAPLPYSLDALSPNISAETLDFHYNKHHASYITKLNALSGSTPLKDLTIEEIVKKDKASLPAGAYNAAAQAWNHTFYWDSLAPLSQDVHKPSEKLTALINKSFGSYDAFKTKFSEVAAGHFGSGWAWLVQDNASGNLKVIETHDAVSPLSGMWSPSSEMSYEYTRIDPSVTAVLTCDVWEHAYYIDYRNARPKYVENWWGLVNWQFAEKNIKF